MMAMNGHPIPIHRRYLQLVAIELPFKDHPCPEMALWDYLNHFLGPTDSLGLPFGNVVEFFSNHKSIVNVVAFLNMCFAIVCISVN